MVLILATAMPPDCASGSLPRTALTFYFPGASAFARKRPTACEQILHEKAMRLPSGAYDLPSETKATITAMTMITPSAIPA